MHVFNILKVSTVYQIVSRTIAMNALLTASGCRPYKPAESANDECMGGCPVFIPPTPYAEPDDDEYYLQGCPVALPEFDPPSI